jgi:hypothetical protein
LAPYNNFEITVFRQWPVESLAILTGTIDCLRVLSCLELNTVPVRNFCVQKLLANSDINATAVAFEVNSSGKDVEVSASPEFWEFLSTGRLKIMHLGVVEDRSILRIFYKGFNMSFYVDVGMIYKSHKKEIEEMAEWEETRFTAGSYKLLRCG